MIALNAVVEPMLMRARSALKKAVTPMAKMGMAKRLSI